MTDPIPDSELGGQSADPELVKFVEALITASNRELLELYASRCKAELMLFTAGHDEPMRDEAILILEAELAKLKEE